MPKLYLNAPSCVPWRTVPGGAKQNVRIISGQVMGNTILIAEDSRHALGMLKKAFSNAGYTVHAARTGAEALEIVKKHEPDCFLLDYHLADGPVDEVCRYVRGHEHLRERPIIMWTGDSGKAEECYEVCLADAFVQKGAKLNVLLATVRHELRRAGARRGLRGNTDLRLAPETLSIIPGSGVPIVLPPEQFRFFALLFENRPDFVAEDAVCRYVSSKVSSDARLAVSALLYRLRKNLEPFNLARRIKRLRGKGWIYVQPRLEEQESA